MASSPRSHPGKQLSRTRVGTGQHREKRPLHRGAEAGQFHRWEFLEVEDGIQVTSSQLQNEHTFHFQAPSTSVNHSVVPISLQHPQTIARQGPLSVGFSRQQYWSGLPFPSPEDLPTQGLNPSLLRYKPILYHLSYREVIRSLAIIY